MTIKDFGQIARLIREEILRVSQDEVAAETGSTQPLVSRMERGEGTFEHALNLLSFYRRRGLNAHMVFYEPFNPELLSAQTGSANLEQVVSFIEEVNESLSGDLNKLIIMVKALV